MRGSELLQSSELVIKSSQGSELPSSFHRNYYSTSEILHQKFYIGNSTSEILHQKFYIGNSTSEILHRKFKQVKFSEIQASLHSIYIGNSSKLSFLRFKQVCTVFESSKFAQNLKYASKCIITRYGNIQN
jgi:hypothetical protein